MLRSDRNACGRPLRDPRHGQLILYHQRLPASCMNHTIPQGSGGARSTNRWPGGTASLPYQDPCVLLQSLIIVLLSSWGQGCVCCKVTPRGSRGQRSPVSRAARARELLTDSARRNDYLCWTEAQMRLTERIIGHLARCSWIRRTALLVFPSPHNA